MHGSDRMPIETFSWAVFLWSGEAGIKLKVVSPLLFSPIHGDIRLFQESFSIVSVHGGNAYAYACSNGILLAVQDKWLAEDSYYLPRNYCGILSLADLAEDNSELIPPHTRH